jgi:hypothetical protein
MRCYEAEEFADFLDRDSGRTFSDLEFRKCSFLGCGISTTFDPRLRSTVRNVRLINCQARGCSVDAAIVEDVLVDGLKTHGMLHTWGAVFKHVTLRGRIGEVMISHMVGPVTATAGQQAAWDEANAAYYAKIDWALDIREAVTFDLDLRGVPARLVRRDPATQVIVTREKALEGRWRELGLEQDTHWPAAIEFLLEHGRSDVVLVAPKRARNFTRLLEGLRILRDAGIAESD